MTNYSSLMLQRLPPINYLNYVHRKPVFQHDSFYCFSHARIALKYGLKALGIVAGNEILLPEYICDVVIHPLSQLGVIPIYYHLNDKFEPDEKDIQAKINAKTSAIFMVHYFGFPQAIDLFQYIAEKNQIFLIEDNAHGYGGKFKNQLLGTFGDVSIMSPRKSFPILNGSYLFIKNKHYHIDTRSLPIQPVNIIFKQIKSLVRCLILKNKHLRRSIMKSYHYIKDTFEEPLIDDWTMDECSFKYLQQQNLDDVAHLRLEIYKIWEDWSKNQKLKPIYNLSSDLYRQAAPLVFPADAASAVESKKWLQWGLDHNVDVYSWPSLPVALRKSECSAFQRWQRLLCFPINTSMNPTALKTKLSRVGTFLRNK